MIKVELTKEEASALLALIDMAVKSNGLNVANAALALAQKIDEAAKNASNGE